MWCALCDPTCSLKCKADIQIWCTQLFLKIPTSKHRSMRSFGALKMRLWSGRRGGQRIPGRRPFFVDGGGAVWRFFWLSWRRLGEKSILENADGAGSDIMFNLIAIFVVEFDASKGNTIEWQYPEGAFILLLWWGTLNRFRYFWNWVYLYSIRESFRIARYHVFCLSSLIHCVR